jgi:L-cystine uptake protein TcyP (sodium:dicarboxylate symporter family)
MFNVIRRHIRAAQQKRLAVPGLTFADVALNFVERLLHSTQVGFHMMGVVLVYGGTCASVGFGLSRCGAAGYFGAYFAAFYLPSFWCFAFGEFEDAPLEDHRGGFDWDTASLTKGVVAALALGALHGLMLLWVLLTTSDKSDVGGWSDFFFCLLPLFLGVECGALFRGAKRRSRKGAGGRVT